MSLHNEIMNIKAEPYFHWSHQETQAYKYGHKDARHAAAELANKYDIEIEKLKHQIAILENKIAAPYGKEIYNGIV